MRSASTIICLACTLGLAILAGAATAGWSPDGNLVSGPTLLDPWDPQVVASPDGGSIVVFVAHQAGYHDIHAQRYDPWGNPLWGDGVAVVVAANEQYAPVAVGDGDGGVIVAWTDFRSGTSEGVYAQRVDADGGVLWAAGGVMLVAGTGNSPRICTDHAGGAVVAWRDSRGADDDIYAQRLDPFGNALWTPGGFGACTATGNQDEFTMADDGLGGAYFVWQIDTGSNEDIYAQRVEAGGWLAWHTFPAGRPVCTATGYQFSPLALADGHGRLITAWLDYRGSGTAVYAQLVDAYGSGQWLTDGVAAAVSLGGLYDLALASDGAGGAVVAWDDGDIVAQRLDPGGNLLWGSAGVTVCGAARGQYSPCIAPDGAGGSLIAWMDDRFGNVDVYAQRLDAGGMALWPTDGVAVSSAVGGAGMPQLAADLAGGATITWPENRSGLDHDIYVQRVEGYGHWGYPCPVIGTVADIPGDQGGLVNVTWAASRLDLWPDEAIDSYSLWRALDAGAKSVLAGATVVDLADFRPGEKGRCVRRDNLADKTLYWEYVGELAGRHLTSYAQALPTLFDLTPQSPGYHAFQVVAHGPTPMGMGYWVSEPDTGRSIDNLAPTAPKDLTGAQIYEPVRLELVWAPNGEADLSHYAVHRGTTPGFVPTTATLVARPDEPLLVDPQWGLGSAYHYKVSAVDVHGNESPFTLLVPDAVSGAPLEDLPAVTALTGLYPNPFNPQISITFTVAEPQTVELAVFDLTGRRVAVLGDGPRSRGTHTEVWTGRDEAGRAVASGTYFVSFRGRTAATIRKVMLVR